MGVWSACCLQQVQRLLVIPLVDDSSRPPVLGCRYFMVVFTSSCPISSLTPSGLMPSTSISVAKVWRGAMDFEVGGDRRQLLFGGEVDDLNSRGPLFGEGGKVPAPRPFRWKHPRAVTGLAQAQQFANAVAERYVAF